ncbi:MAG: hypothetical protein LH645_06005 [Actinomycetia bacterium]|nr:hypothetical protein [Actinomycetes bacterium]
MQIVLATVQRPARGGRITSRRSGICDTGKPHNRAALLIPPTASGVMMAAKALRWSLRLRAQYAMSSEEGKGVAATSYAHELTIADETPELSVRDAPGLEGSAGRTSTTLEEEVPNRVGQSE